MPRRPLRRTIHRRVRAKRDGVSVSVAVCHVIEYFLTPTETFIYRQLLDTASAVRHSVVARERANEGEFPFSNVAIVPGWSAIRSLRRRLEFHQRTLFPPTPWMRKWFQSELARQVADVVHAHFIPAGLLAMRLLPRDARPLVVSAYGYDLSSFPVTKRAARLAREVLLRADRLIALSEHMKSRMVALGAPADHVRIVRVFVALDRYRSLERPVRRSGEPLRILHVARLTPKKGTRYLVEALALARARGSHATLSLVGSGPEQSILRNLVESRGLGDCVVFLGSVGHGELPRLFHSHDVFAHPSITADDGDEEGTPTVILEAAAAGMPILATTHAGIPEIVEHRRSGLLAAERDPEGLANAIDELDRDATQLGPMGEIGRKKVIREFSPIVQAERLVSIYRELAP